MKRILVLAVLAASSVGLLLADEPRAGGPLPETREPVRHATGRRSFVQLPEAQRGAPSPVPGFVPAPFFQNPSSMQMQKWHHEADFPHDYDTWGAGENVPDAGFVKRDDWGFGMQLRNIYGGGCVPAGGPDAPPSSGCLTETDSNGNSVVIYKERERWTMQVKYVDPTTKIETELPGALYELEYTAHTPTYNLECFNVYPCDYYGIPLNPLPGITVELGGVSCSLNRGPGYVTTLFYQYSRYKAGQVPAGAQEWWPDTVLEQNGKAATYGKAILVRNWSLKTGDGAFALISPGMIHPSITSGFANPTGGDTLTTLAAGTGKITVRAYDCGTIDNLAFNIDVKYVPGSGGHGHNLSGDTSPDFSKFGSISASYSGATGSGTQSPGLWSSPTITAGVFAGDFELTATTSDPRVTDGAATRTATSGLSFGFGGLSYFDVEEPDLATYFRMTGDRNGPNCGYVNQDPTCTGTGCAKIQICDNHLLVNHYGTQELKDYIVDFAVEYYLEAVDQGIAAGALGINDMSLPHGGRFDLYGQWADPLGYSSSGTALGTAHGTHRFGVDVDIDNNLMTGSGAAPVNKALLTSVVEGLGGERMPEGPKQIHYRLPATVIDTIVRRYQP